ncbi:MAG TPA: choice-of-anchor Q domain-containing protein [Dokdonella sp.]
MTAADYGDTVDLTELDCSTITLTQGEIVSNAGTVLGPGADRLTIDGGGIDRVFNFPPGSNVYDLAIRHGHVVGDYASGGCIGGFLTIRLISSRVTDCIADGESSAVGGGIASGYGVSLVDSVVTGNTAIAASGLARGGGVYGPYGGVGAFYSTIAGNVAAGASGSEGGGAFAGGAGGLVHSTVSGNSADTGGGLFLTQGFLVPAMLEIDDSTVSGNVAHANGGGVASTFTTSAAVANSTIAFNRAETAPGGGLDVASNQSMSLTLQSSIVAMNTGYYAGYGFFGSDLHTSSPSQLTVVGSNNLVMRSQLPVPPDTLSADPMLAPLAANGGPTMTHALLPGSPAIDAGNDAAGLDTDQRGPGYARRSGLATDIGAFEVVMDLIFANGFD